MKGSALLVHSLLALAIVGFVASCGGDDDDDTAGAGGSAGAAGTTAGSGGSKAGSGGSSGAGGSAGATGGITADMCVANSMKESPMTPMACLTCICGKDPKIIDAVDMAGWGLIECIGAKCDGVGTSPCVAAAAPGGCGDKVAAGAATASPTSSAFGMCKTECGIGDMPAEGDGGTTPGGDAGI